MAGHCEVRATAGGRSGHPAVHRTNDPASHHNAVHDVDYAGSPDSDEVHAEAGGSLRTAVEAVACLRAHRLHGGSGMSFGSVEFLGRLHRVTSRQGGSWRFYFRICSG